MEIYDHKRNLHAVNVRRRELIETIERRDGKPTPAEVTELRNMGDESTRLGALITAAQQAIDDERVIDEVAAANYRGKHADAASQAGTRFRTASGTEIRALAPSERLSSLPAREALPDGIRTSDLDLGRLIAGAVTGDWQGREAERACMLRTMSVGNAVTGGILAPEGLSARVIDLARDKAVCQQAGAVTIPLDVAELTIARQTGDATAYWRGENHAITESDLSFDWLSLKPIALAAIVRTSVELLEDAANMGALISSSIAQALALELDRVALMGDGIGEPLGLWNNDHVGEIVIGSGGNGDVPTTWSSLAAAIQTCREANGEPGAAIYNARTAGTFDRLIDGLGQPLAMPQSVAGLKRLITNSIPNDLTEGTSADCSAAFVGDFRELVFGMRRNIVLETFRGGDSDSVSKMQVVIRAYLRADVAAVRPAFFTRIRGIRSDLATA